VDEVVDDEVAGAVVVVVEVAPKSEVEVGAEDEVEAVVPVVLVAAGVAPKLKPALVEEDDAVDP